MASVFNPYQKRIFLCYGKTRDRFCLPDYSIVGFDEFLYRHLKSLNYERILYYSHRGLYFFDEFSQQSAICGVSKPQTLKEKKPSGLSPGPGGLSLRVKRKSAAGLTCSTDSNTPIRWRYPNMPATEIIQMLERIMRESVPNSAVIFYTDYLNSFFDNPETTQLFRGMLESDFRALPAANRNIIIFVFGFDADTLTHELRGKPWDFLFGIDRNGEIQGVAHPVFIGSPEKDEVERLIHYYRLTKKFNVEWKALGGMIYTISAHFKSKAETLTCLERCLEEKSGSTSIILNPATIRDLIGTSVEEKSAKEQLNELSGLEQVKQTIESQIRVYQDFIASNSSARTHKIPETNIERLNPARGCRKIPPNFNLHLALKGNSGTGKTTIAKLIGEIFRDAGILELGHTVKVTKKDLEAGYVGQTVLKTRQKIDQAMGGVLFIDEAYSLIQGGENNYGREALTEILEAMTDHHGQFAVIIAGYPEEIDAVIDSNPGFKRRFADILCIEDFKPEILERIFRKTCADYIPPLILDAELDHALPGFFDELYNHRDKRFGNAGTVKDEIFMKIIRQITLETNGPRIAKKVHFPETYQKYFKLSEAKPDLMESLDTMIGLTHVKNRIHELILNKKYQAERAVALGKDKNELKPEPGHYIFIGNPGTGKTTVAELMAAQLKQIGLLKTDRLISVSAPEIIQGFVGQTEGKTMEILNKSLGGVCFIDEAHQLVRGGDHDFGRRVLDVIVPFMEKHRHEFSLIFAGYPHQMESVFNYDPGLRRRFEPPIIFEDYTPEELVSIFYLMAQKQDYTVSPDAHPVLLKLFQTIEKQKTDQFGNAGTVRQILKIACTRQVNRLNLSISSPTKDDLVTILVTDIPEFKEVSHFK